MNTSENREIKQTSIDMEYRLLRLIEKLRNDFGHYRKLEDGSEERGFYFYFIRSIIDLGYILPGIKKNSTFDEIISSKNIYRRLMKTLSAKFSRHSRGSSDAIEDFTEYNTKKELVYYSTLSSLSFLEIFVLVQDLSDLEIVELFKGKDHIKKIEDALLAANTNEAISILKETNSKR